MVVDFIMHNMKGTEYVIEFEGYLRRYLALSAMEYNHVHFSFSSISIQRPGFFAVGGPQ